MPTRDLSDATIVFDLDGTLVDSAPDLMRALNAVLVGEGSPPLSLETTRSLIGHGAKASLIRAFALRGVGLAEPRLTRVLEAFTDHYRTHIADFGRPFPEVAEALDALAARGARLAVCTNKRGEMARALLDAVGLAHRLDAVVSPEDAPASKPDPRHLLAAIGAAGGRPDRAVMVGDSALDAQAARAAGVPLVLVEFGYSQIPARDLAPDVLLARFGELPDACARLLGPPPPDSALSAGCASAIAPSPCRSDA